MLFITDYRLRPGLSKPEVKRLMDEFASRGAAPGEISHHVRLDGSGGVTISENDDASEVYGYVLAFTEWMQFDITPALKIDDAVGPILGYIGA
jgi:hypothetical protein